MSITERDNLLISGPYENKRDPEAYRDPSHQGISRDNTFKLLDQMPNLQSLHLLFFEWDEYVPNLEKTFRLGHNLTFLSAHASGIQNFSIRSLDSIPASSIINTIKLLPNLQSFTCGSIKPDYLCSAGDFATAISELKQLCRLFIGSSDVLNGSNYPAAPNILDLTVAIWRNITMSQAPSSISAWTPQLTHLTLWVVKTDGHEDFNPSHYRFHLPSLTHLSLDDWSDRYLQCFQDCKNIRQLTYPDLTPDILETFWDLISTNFSQLEILITHQTHHDYGRSREQQEEDYRKSVIPLRNLCQQNGIKFFISVLIDPIVYQNRFCWPIEVWATETDQ